MKKIAFFIILVLIMIGLFTGCNNKSKDITPLITIDDSTDNAIDDTIDENKKPSTNSASPFDFFSRPFEKIPADDIDFTILDEEIYFNVFYNLLTYTDDYMGKTIKIRGMYAGFYDEDSAQYYHFVVVSDEAGCCQPELQFAWSDGNIPDNYPEDLAEIEMIGVQKKGYNKAYDYTYHYLEVDNITIL